MGHVLKEFIKERLYGNMINYTRKTNSNQAKFTPFISSFQEDSLSKIKSSGAMLSDDRRRMS